MDITRPRSESEKDIRSGGFLDLRYWRQEDFTQKELVKIDAAYNEFVHKKRIPYSTKAAMLFLEKKKREIEEKIKRAKDNKETNVTIDLKIDWNRFGGLDKFDLIEIEEDVTDTHIVSGVRQPFIIGVYKKYKCKETGSECLMFFSNKEIEEEEKGPKVKSKDARDNNKGEQQTTQNPFA